MGAREFWEGDPRLAPAYRSADRERQERKYQAEGRSGLYVLEAIATALSKGHSYPELPLLSTDPERARAERERAQMERARAAFKARADKVNARMAGGGEGGQAPGR